MIKKCITRNQYSGLSTRLDYYLIKATYIFFLLLREAASSVSSSSGSSGISFNLVLFSFNLYNEYDFRQALKIYQLLQDKVYEHCMNCIFNSIAS